jgi:hypothetical protein
MIRLLMMSSIHTLRLSIAALAFGAMAAHGVMAATETSPVEGNAPTPSVASGKGGLLSSATELYIDDSWVGYGCPHELLAYLTASRGVFTGTAVLFTGHGKSSSVNKLDPETKVVTIPAAAIVTLEKAMEAAFERMAAKAAHERMNAKAPCARCSPKSNDERLAAKPPSPRNRPKSELERNVEELRELASARDEKIFNEKIFNYDTGSRSGSMTFNGPAGLHKIYHPGHYQYRGLRWEHDGKREYLDVDLIRSQQGKAEIWRAYSEVLVAFELGAWRSKMCSVRR